jgi:hypothetical protein
MHMRKQACRFFAAAVIATATIAGSAAPSMAAATHASTTATVMAAYGSNPNHFVPGPAPANQTRTSHTSQNAWATWNKSGADLGGGAAGLISAAFFGIPAWILDTVSGIFNALHL